MSDPTPLPRPARPAAASSTTSHGTHAGAFTPLDWGLFLAIGCIWGSSFLFIRIGLDAFAPGLITSLRILLGAAALWLVPAARSPVDRADRPRLIVLSVLWVAIPFTLFPLAEQHITSGLTGLLNGALPIFAGVDRRRDAPPAARSGPNRSASRSGSSASPRSRSPR